MLKRQTVLLDAAGNDVTGDGHIVNVNKALVSVGGVFSGATVELDLSDDSGVTWAAVRDFNGTIVSIDAARMDIYLEMIAIGYMVRARTVGGDGSTALNVKINH